MGLLFNTSQKNKKQTHLIAHTLPHLAVDYLNKPLLASSSSSGSSQRKKKRLKVKREDEHEGDGDDDDENEDGCWVMILKIGPFDRWSNAMAFLNMWTSKTRGKMRRLERGIELFNDYKDKYQLRMWIQQTDRDASLEQFRNANANADAKSIVLPDIFVSGVQDAADGDDDDDDDDNNQCKLTAASLKAVFGTRELETVRVRAVKDIHQALTKKRKTT